MTRFGLLLTALIYAGWLFGQSVTLQDWNSERVQRNQKAMWVLGGWAAANMVAGAVGMSRTQGEQRAFHQMNLGWNVVNAGLAASGLWRVMHSNPAVLDAWHSRLEWEKTQRLFLFNAGLDIGYVMAGMWMRVKGQHATTHAERWKGFGKSLILQGAFLFVFDLGAFLYHQPLGEKLKPFLKPESTTIGFQVNGFFLKPNF